jgi:hypothetical protein
MNEYIILEEKLLGMWLLRRGRRRCEDNIKMNLKETDSEVRDG